MPFDDRATSDEHGSFECESDWRDALVQEPIILDRFDESALFEVQALQRIGFWPERSSLIISRPGGPFISDIGNFRSLHFAWNSVQSGMAIGDPLKLTLDYTRVMMGFLFFNRYPRRIEMIGLGGGSLVKFCHDILPESDITVIEIDPEIIALREHFSIPADDRRFRVLCADGADYVRDDRSEPDIIMVDGFDTHGQPAQLCSTEFYQRCHDRLANNGLLIVNLLEGPPGYDFYLARLRKRFRGEVIVVSSAEGSNRTVIASKGRGLSLSKPELASTCKSLPQRHAAFLPAVGKRIRFQIERKTRQENLLGTGAVPRR